MAATRKSIDAQDKYDSLVLETIKTIDNKVDKIDLKTDKLNESLYVNTAETKKINGRLTRVENKVFDAIPDKLPTNILKDPKVQKVLLYIAAGCIAIYATAKGINLPIP